MENENRKLYQLVLIWITDPVKFQDYIQKMRPIVGKYGGTGDRSFQPSAIWANGIELPHLVNFVHYDSKKAYEDFNSDPEFKKIEHLRSESTRLISYEGYLIHEKVLNDGLAEREYNVEILNYKSGQPEAYRRYEREGEAKMKEYGFEVEYILDPGEKPSGIRQPDLVKISYFRSEGDKAAFERDPVHKDIEQTLYPQAVENLIWISAKIHPMALSN